MFIAFEKLFDFEELFEKMSDIDANILAHVKTQAVSRERSRPSKQLPGNLFYLVKTSSVTLLN
jgi:hypothetical protein